MSSTDKSDISCPEININDIQRVKDNQDIYFQRKQNSTLQ